jgi:serine/threonine protein kinase
MVKQLAPCLDFLHKIGVVHRDIKPSNILLKMDKSGVKNSPRQKTTLRNNTSSNIYKLTDFDLAYCDYRSNTGKFDKKLEMQDVVGSIEYMSPEIASNLLEENTEIELEQDISYSEKTDIWSFGVMLYQVLTGERPFTNVESPCGEDCDSWNYGESCIDCEESVLEAICDYQVEFPERLWRDISWEAKDLVKKCLIGDCDKRISAEEIIEHPFVTKKRCVSGKGSNSKTQILPFGRVKSKINGGMSTSAAKQFLSPIKNFQKSTSLPSMGAVEILDSLPNPFEFFVPKAAQN